jgi:hypothetical protein
MENTNLPNFIPICFLKSKNEDDFRLKLSEYKLKRAFYLVYIYKYDGYHTFKWGQTSNVYSRINKHKRTYIHKDTGTIPILYYFIVSPFYIEIEKQFDKFIHNLKLNIIIEFEDTNKIELFKITEKYNINFIMNKLNDIVQLITNDPETFFCKTNLIYSKNTNEINKVVKKLKCENCNSTFSSASSISHHKKVCKGNSEARQ